MAKSLFGKNPDLDDVDFVEAIEAAFGIAFRREELEAWSTFGDVFDATCRHVQPVERGLFPCQSASAYRRIKRAVLKDQPNVNFRPETSLSELIGKRGVLAWWRGLEQGIGLRLPALTVANWAGLLLLGLLLAVPGVVTVNGLPGWIAVLFPMLWIFAFRWLPSRPRVRTVADLARSVAALCRRRDWAL